jgi:hypothetical protein
MYLPRQAGHGHGGKVGQHRKVGWNYWNWRLSDVDLSTFPTYDLTRLAFAYLPSPGRWYQVNQAGR